MKSNLSEDFRPVFQPESPSHTSSDEILVRIEELAARCRFGDCRHESEPGCAIRGAIAAGTIPEDRLDHYVKLQKEAHSYELRQNEHKKRKAERAFGQLVNEVKRMNRWKRGE